MTIQVKKTLLRVLVSCTLATIGFSTMTHAEDQMQSISKEALQERISEGGAPLILDVRTQEEFAEGHISGAVNIPHTELAARLAELGITKDQEVIVHCRSGKRAAIAQSILTENGYSQVVDLEGHWLGWNADTGQPAQ